MIKEITKRLIKSRKEGLFHDTRNDVLTIMEHNNILQDKINELVWHVNQQTKELKGLKEATKK